jgi:hypothetical protein
VLILPSTMFPSCRAQMFLMRQVDKGIELGIQSKNNAAAVAAVAAARAAAWSVFFPEEGDTTPSPVSGFDEQSNFINEMHKKKKSP